MRLDAVLDDPVAQAMKSKCWNVMKNVPKRTKGPTGDGADDEYSYRTLQSSRWLCMCTYAYAGIQRHEIYQHAPVAATDPPVMRAQAPKARRVAAESCFHDLMVSRCQNWAQTHAWQTC